jgi:uncharacterized protein (TIGR02147 family)
MNVFGYEDIRTLLKDELYRRTVKNSKYSVRKFAKDLNISSSRLSELINFKKGDVSLSTLKKIARGLKLSEDELDYFYQLTLSNSSTRPRIKALAHTKLAESNAKNEYAIYRDEFHGLMQKWYYLALIELLTIGSHYSNEFISEKLGIPENEIASAIEHLCEHKYVIRTKDGKYEKSNSLLKVESNTPSTMIQNYHIEMSAMAKRALQTQPIQNRKFLTSVISFEKKYLAEARVELENFIMQFTKKYISTENADSVYCAGLQFFEIDHQENK